MPGYEDDVIMAAGTFIQGASIELSADGPIRPPYVAYVQGGLTYSHVKIAICSAIDALIEKRIINNFLKGSCRFRQLFSCESNDLLH
ncbi:methionine gamma-lyase family protein [Bacillus paranthracis]